MAKIKNTKAIVRFYISISGNATYFRTKELAIKIGKMAKMNNAEVRLMEEYILWDVMPGIPAKLIDKQVFDRTNLLTI